MKNMKKSIFLSILTGCAALFVTGCNLDEISYSQVTPDTFYTSPENTYAVLARPFTHWKYYVDPGRESYRVLELSSDEMCCPKRGSDFYNSGNEQMLWYHTWTADHPYVQKLYELTLQGVAYALAARDDLSALDYSKFGMTDQDKTHQLGQLDGITGFFYLMGLDTFGGLPIYKSSTEQPKGRSTERELFFHVEQLLLRAIDELPAKQSLKEAQDGYMRKAAAAILLARLYFNAEAYLVDRNTPDTPADLEGVDYFAKAQKICEDLRDGVYGPYAIESEWNAVHSFDNNVSTEAVWSVPNQTNYLESEFWYRYFLPYNIHDYFNIEKHTAYNGYMLTPSLDPVGNKYSYKLGGSYSKFNDADLRKKPYYYKGGKKYEGMFLVGKLVNPDTGVGCVGNREYSGQVITLVDQVARFSEVGKKYASVEDLTSTMNDGEESSGVRLVKWPVPNQKDVDIRWDADYAYVRFTEVNYMLAECYLRAGRKKDAAGLINEVRARNFTNRMDPDPVTEANLDMYRMLDEWQIEFLGETRRRTDLIRWGQFTEGEWWDHKPSRSKHLNRFPIPTTALVASSGLVLQTPGYTLE